MPPKQGAASDNMIKPLQIKLSILNPNTNQILGRTASSWGKIILFYVIFYIPLAALFSTCMTTVHATLDKDIPINPGLEFHPLEDVADGALINYNSSDPKSQQKYIDLLQTFFADYDIYMLGKVSNFAPECNFEHKPSSGIACPVDITGFGDCNPPFYGYNRSKSPCIFLTLNKIYDWVPTYYNDSNDVHEDMPKALVNHINEAQRRGESNQVWVNCEGEYPSDREHIINFNYFPGHGFPGYYYPYQHNMDEYLSPIVAVQIMYPQAYKQVIIECRAWAKNIQFVGGPAELRRGSVRFELLRDE